MPTYRYKCSVCNRSREVFKRLAEIDRGEACSNCNFAMNRQICAPAVHGDYAAYTCPITGDYVEGRRAHTENLKKHGCRVLEPGETSAAATARRQEEDKLDTSVDTTVEQFIETLPTQKKEQLFNEVASGLDVTVERN